MDHASLRPIILDHIVTTARQQNLALQPLSDDRNLMECGLDSLGLAIVVAKLEDDLGLDPLSDHDAAPVTLGDFIRMYENAARHG